MTTITAPLLRLNNGVEMPALGLRVFQSLPPRRSPPSRFLATHVPPE